MQKVCKECSRYDAQADIHKELVTAHEQLGEVGRKVS